MIEVKTKWRVWQPTTPEDKDAVRRELKAIGLSPHFCNSKRYPALLNYVVEHALAGCSDKLKERVIGIDVFERLADYDTHSDTIVRYTAGEVRKRLSLFYHERDWDLEAGSRIQISLPPGSYVPEFLCASPDENNEAVVFPVVSHQVQQVAFVGTPESRTGSPSFRHSSKLSASPERKTTRLRNTWVAILTALVVAGSGFGYVLHKRHTVSAVETFWNPVLHGRGTPLICAGTVVFGRNAFSGTATAGKDEEYSFVSIQQAAAIGLLSGLLDNGNRAHVLQSASPTPLSELRERPVILLGGYNNDWTFRLQKQLRFQFLPEPEHSIVDTEHAGKRWARDQSLPYSNSDDYALIARYNDSSTDGVVVILAGIGRNGTEAATQFVTSPHYMQLLADRIGSALATRNIEVVLKIDVIEGKTGAPTIQDVHVW